MSSGSNDDSNQDTPKIRYVLDLDNPNGGDEDDVFISEEELKNGNFIELDENDIEKDNGEMSDDDDEGNHPEDYEAGEDQDYVVDDDDIEENAQFVLKAHTDSIYAIGIHPTRHEIVVTGGGDDVAYVWNMVTNPQEPISKLEHKDSVTGIDFNFDGKFCGTSSLDGTVKVWSADNGSLVSTCEGPEGGLNWLRWHNKGNVLIAGSEDGSAWMWLSNGTFMQVFTGHGGSVTCGSFSSSGKVVLTGSEDSTLRVWDPKNGKSLFTFAGHGFHEGPITCMTTTPLSDSVVMSGSEDGSCKISNIETGKVLTTFNHAESVESVAFSKIEGFAATGSMDKTAKIWDLNTKSDRLVLPHDDGVIKVAWNNNSAQSDLLLVTASTDKSIRVWDIRNLAHPLVSTKTGHADVILDMAISADGKFAMTGSDDQTARIFSL